MLTRLFGSHPHLHICSSGRTFPTHAYYREDLGPGQTALRNVLLAYSTFDSAVGYCQGIGFLAGIILSYFVSSRVL